MSNEEPIQHKMREPAESRSLTTDIALTVTGAAVGGVTGGATGAYVSHLLNRPKDPPPPSVELPPGVSKD